MNNIQQHIQRVVFGDMPTVDKVELLIEQQAVIDYALVGPFSRDVLYSLGKANFSGKRNFTISWLLRRNMCAMNGNGDFCITGRGELLIKCCKAIDALLERPSGEITEKVWEIWCEGYHAIGEHRTAFLVDRQLAPTFKDAVDHLSRKHGEASLFNLDKMLYDGRRIFDNERDARKHYG